MKRRLLLKQGQSPGDILVFTGAIRDLKEAYPDWEIMVDTPCNTIFENNPYIGKEAKKPLIYAIPDNLKKLGYSLYEIIKDRENIFNSLTKEGKIKAELNSGEWEYTHIETNLIIFKCKTDFEDNIVTEAFKVGYEEINNSGWSGLHFSNGFHIELEKLLGIKFKQTSLLPDIHLSDIEKSWINQVEQETGYRGKFWLINAGHKKDFILKQWGFDNWQRLVDILKNKIQFVQVGEKGHIHPELKGVINFIGKTDLRQLIRLSYHAQGAVCPVTFQMHLMAAYQKPCVVLAGGREPRRWEMYPHHRYLDTNGLMPCCAYDGCWCSGHIHRNEEGTPNKQCKNVVGWDGDVNNQRSKCMAMISPERVAMEIMNYYEGGILQW